ncbi:MAG: glycoside hydrolase family 43 protein [Bacteroidales bacterium]
MRKIAVIIALIFVSSVAIFAQKTEVTIKGDAFYINNRPTYEGRYWNGNKVEGLLMNSRMVQGVFDDITGSEQAAARFAYKDTGKWDAERNTKEFVAAMEDWYKHGLLAFTLNLQGGSPMGYGGNKNFVNSAFDKNGTFRSDYKARLKSIIERADELGMVVMLGCFYQGQDQYLEDEKAIYRALTEVTQWILESGYLNVMIEINNECDVKSYDHEILKVANVHKLIEYVKGITYDGRRLLVSTSLKGCSIPTEEIVAVSDYVLLHGNGMKKADKMRKAIKDTRALTNYTTKPIVVNEDDNYNFDTQFSNIAIAVEDYASWGYFDYRREEDSMSDGFQSVPVDWSISSKRKKDFFNTVKRITNPGGAPDRYKNPILTGYHPDPSICRAGDDYYLINSSFEWYPAIPIYHSKDLVNWELIGYGGTQENNFELTDRAKDSGGIFAATIRYHEGTFYIITTNTNYKGGKSNFYITAKDPAGEWSEPVYLKAPGIDPSLFWDDDGKCYYIGQGHRLPKQQWVAQQGAWIQELDLEQGKLVGERKQLTHGHASNARAAEGPHLYKIGDKYLLLVAEGGTYRGHAVTSFESDSLWGPYTPTIVNPIISHRQLGPQNQVSSIGHADIVQTQHGDWWIVTLGRRHFNGYVYLSRETFLSPVKVYEHGAYNQVAVIVNEGEGKMPVVADMPKLPWTPFVKVPVRDDFNGDKLGLEWNELRNPATNWHNLKDGELVIDLRPEVVDSLVNSSLLAKRISHHTFRAQTRVNFKTKRKNEQAGMVLYRCSTGYMSVMKDKDAIVVTSVSKSRSKDDYKKVELCRVPCKKDEVILAIVADGKDVTFEWSEPNKPFQKLDATIPLAILSDDINNGYNGPMVGVYATSNGEKSNNQARFKWFDYCDK